jgi:murein DD-endopeptidase MepM/ murein hydrolase activator NlpD
MAKKQYIFNPKTLAYDEIRRPLKLRLYRMVRFVVIVFILTGIAGMFLSSTFVTPKMRRLDVEREDLLAKYAVLNSRLEATSHKLDELKWHDNNVFRNLFAVDTLSMPEVYVSYPDERYAHLEGVPYSGLMSRSWRRLDEVTRRTYLQSISLDDIQSLAMAKEQMANHIPAIWPIDKRYLHRLSHFNPRRFHPIYRVIRPHTGIDLSTDIPGRAVYATADGIVSRAERGQARRGYGRLIEIDHGFGYKTRYAHLREYFVAEGQKVKRGELIGTVGNTGASTSHHLHYEVLFMNRHVNPITYFHLDMSEEDFQRIIDAAVDAPMEIDE